jgi:hypothetical protein
MIVELKYASIPRVRLIAVHYWFVTNVSGRRERWEVWQRLNAGGISTGHLYRNLMRPERHVGGGPTKTASAWDGVHAEKIVTALHESWHQYPHRDEYRMVPGPNSNTFISWVLYRSGVNHRLSWRAIGRHFVLP